ncbi:unnamed protein product [Parajaminaea phylloscopi]
MLGQRDITSSLTSNGDDDHHSCPDGSRRPLMEDMSTPADRAQAHPRANGASSRSAQRQRSGDPSTGAPYARRGFAHQLFAPATEWFDAMQWTQGRPKSDARRRLQLIVSYAPDWVLTLLLALLLALLDRSHGHRREFSLTDKSLQYTHTLDEAVPVWLLIVLAFVAPLVIQLVISLGIARSAWDFHASFLALVLSHALTVTATTLIKITVGRPRPDLIDRCQPRAGAQDPSPFGLVTDSVCTNPVGEHLVKDGFRSFPSGHASTAFAGLTFLSLYLAGKFHLYGTKGYAAVQWLVFVPMIGATLIAVSRTSDYRHHASDVIAGGILGAVVAVSTYFTYYPGLFHRECHKPYPPRIPRGDQPGVLSMLPASSSSGSRHGGSGAHNGPSVDEAWSGPEASHFAGSHGGDLEAQDEAERASAWKAPLHS